MKDGLIFANARAKGKENTLLTKERLMRMTEAKTLTEAMRVLSETSYAGGFIPEKEDFYSLLAEEERLVTAFVKEAAPENSGVECFFLRNDYHNIKVLFKQKFASVVDMRELVLPDGNYTLEYLSEKFAAAKLDFSPEITEACRIINNAFESGKGTPRLIDIVLDRAFYADVNRRLAKGVDKYIKQYFEAETDFNNILSCLRARRAGCKYSFFAEGFIDGGKLKLDDFSACGGDIGRLGQLVSINYPKDICDYVLSENLIGLEKARDEYLLRIFEKNRTDMFSVAPLVGFYLAKRNELMALRVVFVCIKNGIGEEEMKLRLRELYG